MFGLSPFVGMATLLGSSLGSSKLARALHRDDGTLGPHPAMIGRPRGQTVPARGARFANLVIDGGQGPLEQTGVLGCASAPEEAQGATVPFDGRPEDWEGPRCKGCRELIQEGQRTTESSSSSIGW